MVCVQLGVHSRIHVESVVPRSKTFSGEGKGFPCASFFRGLCTGVYIISNCIFL
jgi:hypothetical protein